MERNQEKERRKVMDGERKKERYVGFHSLLKLFLIALFCYGVVGRGGARYSSVVERLHMVI